jgi:HEAT repeat protein
MPRSIPVTLLMLICISASISESRADQFPQLIGALNDANVRQGASIALTKRGEAAVPALRNSLKSGKPDVRVWSAYTLGEIGQASESSVGELCKALSDSDHALRSAAAQALGRIGSSAAVEALASALDDDDAQVRQHAAVALGKIGPPSRASTSKLIAALSDPDVRPLAREALIQIGSSTAGLLTESLHDDTIRFDASAVLREVDPAKAKQLGLDDPSAADLSSLRVVLYDESRPLSERSAAAISLASLSDDGVAVLVGAFEQPTIARMAASAFAKTGPTAVPALVDAMSHQRPGVRTTAADALGHIGPTAAEAATHLIQLLKDQDRNVRYSAVRALHEFGQKAKPAVSALTEVILDSKELEPTRQWAIKTLIVTLPETHDEVVKALIEACKEETNYGVRSLAERQLRKIDLKAAEAAGIK